MYKATTARVINIGTQGRRQVWTAMAGRTRFEQFLAIILGLILAIPILVVVLGTGALLLAFILVVGVTMSVVGWFKRRFGAQVHVPTRENVRVIKPSERARS